MTNSKINVTRSGMPPYEEYCEEIKDIWQSHHLTNMGPKHNKLQDSLCDYLSAENISLFTNGHLALEAVLGAMKLKGEVITTPFTFASTTQAIVRCGLTPVFCDVKEDDCTIDPEKIEKLITPNTCAIVPVHVYGNICSVFEIESIARRHDLKVIYDAAHVFGVRVGERGIASFGDASMFSFHATKVFNTIEGGCVAYSDGELTQKLQVQKNFGMENAESYPEICGNSKMNEFQAAMGLCNLKHVDAEIKKRGMAAARYIERLGTIKGVRVWKKQDGVTPNYAYFPVFFDKEIFGKSRDEVSALLAEQNVFARKYFYPITSEFAAYCGRFPIQKTPVAKKLSESVLTLPMYAGLEIGDVDRICDIILK